MSGEITEPVPALTPFPLPLPLPWSAMARDATEKAIAERDCPWCTAKAGEMCITAQHEPFRAVEWTHIARFPTDITPDDYVSRAETSSE